MLLVYNYEYVLLKMSTWYSKHVEESNNIWRINNIQCITLVVLYGYYMIVFHTNNSSAIYHKYVGIDVKYTLFVSDFIETWYDIDIDIDMI